MYSYQQLYLLGSIFYRTREEFLMKFLLNTTNFLTYITYILGYPGVISLATSTPGTIS